METHIDGASFGFVFSFHGMWYLLCSASSDARLVARTHEPCVPTCRIAHLNDAISPQKYDEQDFKAWLLFVCVVGG